MAAEQTKRPAEIRRAEFEKSVRMNHIELPTWLRRSLIWPPR